MAGPARKEGVGRGVTIKSSIFLKNSYRKSSFLSLSMKMNVEDEQLIESIFLRTECVFFIITYKHSISALFLLQGTERSGELFKWQCYLGNWADHHVPGAGMYF